MFSMKAAALLVLIAAAYLPDGTSKRLPSIEALAREDVLELNIQALQTRMVALYDAYEEIKRPNTTTTTTTTTTRDQALANAKLKIFVEEEVHRCDLRFSFFYCIWFVGWCTYPTARYLRVYDELTWCFSKRTLMFANQPLFAPVFSFLLVWVGVFFAFVFLFEDAGSSKQYINLHGSYERLHSIARKLGKSQYGFSSPSSPRATVCHIPIRHFASLHFAVYRSRCSYVRVFPSH